MAEFTGERVIPGEVDPNLWNEHFARYLFARHMAKGVRVLDVGCGTGYGAAHVAPVSARVVALDLAAAAISYARGHYYQPNLAFLQASCTALPFGDSSFDLVTAFELIEHLADWKALLAEARRVLAPGGAFVVSTPNRLYYEESRRAVGPNPFHVHEFDFAGFRAALAEHFPCVTVYRQNHTQGILIVQPSTPLRLHSDAPADPRGDHFFVAVCSAAPVPPPPSLFYLPESGNVLRERERHIKMLRGELDLKDEWLETAKADLADLNAEHQKLLAMFREQTAELERRNAWAESLNRELEASADEIRRREAERQQELQEFAETAAAYDAKIVDLERENVEKTAWALDTEQRLSAEVRDKSEELARCVALLDAAERTVEERTLWAQRNQAELDRANARFAMIRQSRWLKLGRAIHLGPRLAD